MRLQSRPSRTSAHQMPSIFTSRSSFLPSSLRKPQRSVNFRIACIIMATLIPRFLLPQTSWKSSRHYPNAHSLPWNQGSRVKALTRVSRPLCQKLPTRHASTTSSRFAPRCAPVRNSNSLRLHSQQRRCFSVTQNFRRDHHFDTLKFVQRLKDEGFSEEQSKAMMLVLSDVIEESIQNLTRTMVLREGSLLSLRNANITD